MELDNGEILFELKRKGLVKRTNSGKDGRVKKLV